MNELSTEEIDLLSSMVKTASGRVEIINSISTDHPDNWQSVSTPYDIVREMCDLVPEATHFCVLFSMEFLEVLVKERGVSPENVLFFGDNKLEALIAGHQKMYGVHTRVLSKSVVAGNGFDSSILAQLLREGVDTMKFSKLCCLMNPPYQIEDGGQARSAKPIYHLFIETIIDELSPDYLVSVNPSRWMIGGKGLSKFRQRIMADRRMKVIVDDPSSSGIFPSVDIAGGVNYFLWEKDYNGKCLFNGVERYLDEFDIVVRENESRSILEKIKKISSKWIGSGVSPSKPYGLRGNVKPTKSGVPCWFKNSIGLSFVDPTTVKDPRHDVQTWRVLVPRAMPGNIPLLVDGGFFNEKRIIIAKPGEYCTETFVVVRTFTCKSEAENFLTYLNTRFFRFMLRMRTVSQDVTRGNYNWVPDVEDYSCTWTDKELYTKFGLTRQEIKYIESKIKELK